MNEEEVMVSLLVSEGVLRHYCPTRVFDGEEWNAVRDVDGVLAEVFAVEEAVLELGADDGRRIRFQLVLGEGAEDMVADFTDTEDAVAIHDKALRVVLPFGPVRGRQVA